MGQIKIQDYRYVNVWKRLLFDCLLSSMYSFKVLLSLYKETSNIWLPIIHSFGFRAEEGHRLSHSYSKKESKSNDILIHFVEFSNVHNRRLR